jgi:hypothetical protein
MILTNMPRDDPLVRYEFEEIKAALEFDRTGMQLYWSRGKFVLMQYSILSRRQYRLEVLPQQRR